MTDFLDLNLAEARDQLRAKSFTARELTEAYLKEMATAKELNAYVAETPDKALTMADKADAALQKGDAGALTGIPLGIKDLFCTKDVHSQSCSHILDNFKPRYESTVTANLWRDGAVMLGKTNMDEFAMGSSNESSYYGAVKNPWRAEGSDRDLVPGGSSGGSAAAVAARIALATTGTDTGGSIRQPAAYTGTVGIKPTYGRCSRWGMISFASSLDQAGPFGRTVRDVAIMLGSMAGYDPKDSTSINKPVPDYEAALTGNIKGLKVGIPQEYHDQGMPEEIEQQWRLGKEWLRDAGAEIVDVSLPHTKYALATYYIVAPAEASSNLARYDGVRYGLRVDGESLDDMYARTRAEGFGAEVQRRILIGTYVLSAGYYDAYYLKAQKVRSLIARDFHQAFQDVDVILAPTAPSAAFALGEKTDDPIAMYLNDVFTVPASLAGLPALSLPAGFDKDRLPLGLQLIGRPFDEENVLKVADVMERAARFKNQINPWWRA